jgi:L-fuconolactonase
LRRRPDTFLRKVEAATIDDAAFAGLLSSPRHCRVEDQMPNFPVIDTHLHLWDQKQLRYSAFEANPLFNHPYPIEDYQRDCGKLDIEAMVFLECYADFWDGGGQYIEEIKFVESEAKRDPRIEGIVPMAPLEWGRKVEPMLRQMLEQHPTVKGIRRIVEFDKNPRALTLSDSFIEGVNLLSKFGWHFEINVNHTQMDIVREFVLRVSDVPLILDHCGKPGIKEGAIEQYDASSFYRLGRGGGRIDLPN